MTTGIVRDLWVLYCYRLPSDSVMTVCIDMDLNSRHEGTTFPFMLLCIIRYCENSLLREIRLWSPRDIEETVGILIKAILDQIVSFQTI
jgi:hypothetical protein